MLSLQMYNLTNKLIHFSFLKKNTLYEINHVKCISLKKKDNPALWTVKIKTL